MKDNKKTQLLDGVKKVISKYGDLVLFCGVDESGDLHLQDFGMETRVMKEIMAHKKILGGAILFFFDKKNLDRNRTYIIKFSVNDGVLRTESFCGMPIIPSMRRAG